MNKSQKRKALKIAWQKFQEQAVLEGYTHKIAGEYAYWKTANGEYMIMVGYDYDTEEIRIERTRPLAPENKSNNQVENQP
jgi:hypothetical protein